MIDIAKYQSTFNLNYFQHQYSIFRGDCPQCGAKKNLLVYPIGRWGWVYCCGCKLATTIGDAAGESGVGSKRHKISWLLYQDFMHNFRYLAPPELLSQYGIPTRISDPLRPHFYNKFMGYCDVTILRSVYRDLEIPIESDPGMPRRKQALCIPIQEFPGKIVAWKFFFEEGEYMLKLDRKAQPTAYVYLEVSPRQKSTLYNFETLQDAVQEREAAQVMMSPNANSVTVGPLIMSQTTSQLQDSLRLKSGARY